MGGGGGAGGGQPSPGRPGLGLAGRQGLNLWELTGGCGSLSNKTHMVDAMNQMERHWFSLLPLESPPGTSLVLRPKVNTREKAGTLPPKAMAWAQGGRLSWGRKGGSGRAPGLCQAERNSHSAMWGLGRAAEGDPADHAAAWLSAQEASTAPCCAPRRGFQRGVLLGVCGLTPSPGRQGAVACGSSLLTCWVAAGVTLRGLVNDQNPGSQFSHGHRSSPRFVRGIAANMLAVNSWL